MIVRALSIVAMALSALILPAHAESFPDFLHELLPRSRALALELDPGRPVADLVGHRVHGEVDAIEVAAGDRQIARLLGATGERNCIVLRFEVGNGDVAADMASSVSNAR